MGTVAVQFVWIGVNPEYPPEDDAFCLPETVAPTKEECQRRIDLLPESDAKLYTPLRRFLVLQGKVVAKDDVVVTKAESDVHSIPVIVATYLAKKKAITDDYSNIIPGSRTAEFIREMDRNLNDHASLLKAAIAKHFGCYDVDGFWELMKEDWTE